MLRIRAFVFLLFIQQFTVAQQFHAINIRKGLPSSEVYDVLEDKQGYIWFATDHGVARYNGKEFKSYTTSDGLLDNTVFRMCEDSKGRIWFASQNNELCYWQKDSIYTSDALKSFHFCIAADNFINRFYTDASDNLWIGSRQIIFFCEAKKNYTTFQAIPVDTNSVYEIKIIEGNKSILSFNREHRIFVPPRLGYQTIFNFHHKDKLTKRQTYTIRPDQATLPFLTSAYGYHSKTDTYYFSFDSLLLIARADKIEAKRLGHAIINIITDRNNDVWIGFEKGGVALYKNGNFNQPPITFLEGVSVNDVLVDHEGGVWISTLERGVFYVPSTSILVYSNIPYLNDHITFIGELNKKVIVCTYGNVTSEVSNFQFKPLDYLRKHTANRGRLYCITKIRDTTYASFAGELMRFAPELLPQKNKQYPRNFAGGKSVFETEDQRIWIASGGGLNNINNQTCTSVRYNSPFRVTNALPQGNTILVGGKKGLYLFKDHQYISLSSIDPLLESQIIEMAKDKEGALWIATIGKGVLRLKNNKVIQITEKEGLISNICTCISIDMYENIWVGTNKGISCIQSPKGKNKKWNIKNIDERTGLNSDDVTKVFAYNNSVWVGTMSGISCIDIKNVLPAIPVSPAYIKNIKVNGNPIRPYKKLFSYQENNLKFELDGLTYKDLGEHIFHYRLIGLDTTWKEIKTGEVLINNLAPGNYRFEAQVANADSIWSCRSATYSFTIDKPFWLTWWFILIEILTLILVVYLIILWRTSIIKRKEQEKLRINKLLAEYQMKALTAQMNPHFIFNAINSIQNFIIQNHSTLAYDYLIKFSKLIRLVLNNSKDNEITLQQELDTLSLYIELEQLRFKDSFDYRLSIGPQVDSESLMIPALLLQPYIENAIWHGLMPLKSHKGCITLTIIKENVFLKITITDNGVGRKASDLIKKKIIRKEHQSIGMELTGKRIELFGQESQFSVQIIDNYDNNNNSTGTTIEIILPMIEMY